MLYGKSGLMNPSKHDAPKVLGDGIADSQSITQFDDLQPVILDRRSQSSTRQSSRSYTSQVTGLLQSDPLTGSYEVLEPFSAAVFEFERLGKLNIPINLIFPAAHVRVPKGRRDLAAIAPRLPSEIRRASASCGYACSSSVPFCCGRGPRLRSHQALLPIPSPLLSRRSMTPKPGCSNIRPPAPCGSPARSTKSPKATLSGRVQRPEQLEVDK